MLRDVIAQANNAARLLERARVSAESVRGLRSGDRVYTPIIAEAEFDQGAAPSTTLVFNVPAATDFWAYRLMLYPFCKVVDPVNETPDEVVFRPTTFAGTPNDPGAVADPSTAYGDFNNAFDAMFALIFQGRELQNIDTPCMGAYSVEMMKWHSSDGVGQWIAASQTPSGMLFDVPLFIPRGQNLTVRVTPTYLGVRTIVETLDDETEITRQHRYKIVGVLEGEKKVAAFR